ncbi:MAG TPA: hypothetical protein VLF20_05165 [Patescibacteria group bacterium]|nr:hypothetical protein [Patescibacteria group bacterium]
MSAERPGFVRKAALGFGWGISRQVREITGEQLTPGQRVGMALAQLVFPYQTQYRLALLERGVDIGFPSFREMRKAIKDPNDPKANQYGFLSSLTTTDVVAFGGAVLLPPAGLILKPLANNLPSYWVGQFAANLAVGPLSNS